MNISHIIKTSVKYCSLLLLLENVEALPVAVKVIDEEAGISSTIRAHTNRPVGDITSALHAQGFDCYPIYFRKKIDSGGNIISAPLDNDKTFSEQGMGFYQSPFKLYATLRKAQFFFKFPIPIGNNPLNPFEEEHWLKRKTLMSDDDDKGLRYYLDKHCDTYLNGDLRCNGFFIEDPKENPSAKRITKNDQFFPGMAIYPGIWEVAMYITTPQGVTRMYYVPITCKILGEALRYIQGDNDEYLAENASAYLVENLDELGNDTPENHQRRKEFFSNPDLDFLNFTLSYKGQILNLTDPVPALPNPQNPIVIGPQKRIQTNIIVHYPHGTGYNRTVFVDPNEPLSVLSFRSLMAEYDIPRQREATSIFFGQGFFMNKKQGVFNSTMHRFEDFQKRGVIFDENTEYDLNSTFSQIQHPEEKIFHVMAASKIYLCFINTDSAGKMIRRNRMSCYINHDTIFTPLRHLVHGVLPPDANNMNSLAILASHNANVSVFLAGEVEKKSLGGKTSFYLMPKLPGGPKSNNVSLGKWFGRTPEETLYVFGWTVK